MALCLPFAVAGQRIGLLGGSFDPPHGGHVHISHQALKRFGLDQVWWVVSPGNPLKTDGPATLERRLAACRGLIRDRRIHVSDLESQLGTRYTADTLAQLFEARRDLRFVWLMGADNLVQFHLWENWHWIAETVPIGILARPETVVRGGLSRMAARYPRARLAPADSAALATRQPPAWCLVTGPMVDLSSTEFRNRGEWPRSS